MKKIRLKSYGKVNMSLDVTGRRDNGYHDIETVMQKISLFDDVTVSWIKKDCEDIEITLTCDKKYLPTDSRNLAFAAAQIMIRKFSSIVGGGVKRQRSSCNGGIKQIMGVKSRYKGALCSGRRTWCRCAVLYIISKYKIRMCSMQGDRH